MVKIGKRSNRGWWWDHFVEHPGYARREGEDIANSPQGVSVDPIDIWTGLSHPGSALPVGAASASGSFSRIAINDLLDYSCAEEWLGSFYKVAIRGLDAELELCELLDLDAEGIDDPDFPQVDDVLDE
ncbi:uncharacterized protein F5147DRAFT_770569 [Suillus discolor]|uniref:Uncharacterized protein n=1 Tax=Suillus discolor TaxID=1912936 RepID=A0A9P7JXA3_9AGAM|nr:uncharacterized protein F5147DRAFT_770569 [Suillus discolor]KAG2113923.1 hypothetical protein F5147DRAFT_770569 [Suillus discolor]